MQVPFLDLKAQYDSIKTEIKNAIDEVLESQNFIQGPNVESFEKNFLKVHGGHFGVGCSNGTSAITVALRALGIGAGDEVITQANTFFATVEAIYEVGATPVLVDCDPETYNINVNLIEAKINSKTKAIIPVHLYGNPCDMPAIMAIAKKFNLKVIEDCAQAHLASINNKAVATFGDAGTFSFYPGKNLGAYGDAGFIISKDNNLNNLMKMHVNHGRTKKYEHDFMAGNFRMDGIQGAILDVKTKYISNWTDKRIEAAKYYDDAFIKAGIKIIKVLPTHKAVYHLYIVEVENRELVMKRLSELGVQTGIHYPVPMHLQPACAYLGYKMGDFPHAENAANKILSIPIFPEITRKQQDYVVESLLKCIV